jgi:hypothetical protein
MRTKNAPDSRVAGRAAGYYGQSIRPRGFWSCQMKKEGIVDVGNELL